MNKISVYLLSVLFLFCHTKAGAQSGIQYTVRGTIRDQLTREVIQGATVRLLQNKNKIQLTDSSGNFEFSLHEGNYKIEITHVSFAKKTFSVSITGDAKIEFSLTSQSKELEAVVVKSSDNRNKLLSSQTSVESIDRKTALTIPAILGEVDIIKVLQLKPGIKNNGEGTSGISVRGGGTDQNLFLIDGTVVYNPNHLFGFFSTFNIDAIRDVQLYKAGFPAEFSGRLSSIVDVNTMKGTDSVFSWGGGIGLIASRLNVQGNLFGKKNKGQKLTYNIAGRRTYADVFTSIVNRANRNDTSFNPIPAYYFYDMNARVDYTLSDKDQFYSSIYHGRDYFKYDSDIFATTFSWGNTAASLHWKHSFNNNLSLHSSIHLADYNYSLQSKYDRFDFKISSGVKDYSVNNKFTYTGFSGHLIKFGVDFTSSQFAISKFNINSTQPGENLANGENISTNEAGIYVADDWDINKKLKLNMGGRFTWFANKKIIYRV